MNGQSHGQIVITKVPERPLQVKAVCTDPTLALGMLVEAMLNLHAEMTRQAQQKIVLPEVDVEALN